MNEITLSKNFHLKAQHVCVVYVCLYVCFCTEIPFHSSFSRNFCANFRAMLAVVATVVFIVCYCCHRNIKRRSESIYRQQWFETDPNMEIFSVEQVMYPFSYFLF